jgi:hypothetical protein
MKTTKWRTAGTALTVGLALISGACAASPDGGDTLAPAPTTPPVTVPNGAIPATPTTAPDGSTTTTVVSNPNLSYAARATSSKIGDCELFPPDHYLNATNIDRLPVHPSSDQWTSYLARGGKTLSAPSATVWNGARGGMPINIVDSRTQPMRSVVLDNTYTSNSYRGGYPIPSSPRLEGYPSAQWDRHLLIVDVADCSAYELIQYDPILGALGIHKAMVGVRYPLNTTEPPRITTNAADTPMIGQYAMTDQVETGRIAHALGFCTTDLASTATWPARRSDGKLSPSVAPPMGAWLRLKADVDLSKFTGQARVIAEALRHHGMILTDTCGHQLNLMAENSDKWNKAQMAQLETLSANQFEVVDTSSMARSTTSFAVR